MLERIHHRSKRGRLADHHPPARSAKIREARLEVPVFCDQRLLFESLLNALDQRVPLERLGDEIIGALFHRRDRRLDRGVGGHQNHLDVRTDAARELEQFLPVHAGHHQVGNDRAHFGPA